MFKQTLILSIFTLIVISACNSGQTTPAPTSPPVSEQTTPGNSGEMREIDHSMGSDHMMDGMDHSMGSPDKGAMMGCMDQPMDSSGEGHMMGGMDHSMGSSGEGHMMGGMDHSMGSPGKDAMMGCMDQPMDSSGEGHMMGGLDHSMGSSGEGHMMGRMDHSMGSSEEGHMMGGMDHSMGSSDGSHMMEPINDQGVESATQEQGGQPLDFHLEDGVKVFELTAKPVKWQIKEGVTVTAWTYNGTVPGPLLQVTEGDRVRVILKNELPRPTTIHWHGVEVPNDMDGVPDMPRQAIQPGESFTYEFVAKPAGTFMYHSHFDSDVQVGVGLYGPFIIEPKEEIVPKPDVDVPLMLSEWRVVNGQTFAAMPMAGMEPNYFTINGKAFPDTETIEVKKGQRVRLRFMNIGQFMHPMHLHGFSFKVVATDGHPVPKAAQLTKDTIAVAPGERYDVEFVADKPGRWMVHCHILHHTTNNGIEPGGLMLILDVTE